MAALDRGTYRGAAEGLVFDFRVGRHPDGRLQVVSGDATRDGTFVATFVCTAPAEEPSAGTITGTVRFRGHPELVSGQIRLEADERGIGSFYLGVDLAGNYRDAFAGRLERLGGFMRRLTIEIDGIQGTLPPGTNGYSGRSGAMTIAKAFEGAGFETTVRVDAFRGRVPRPQRTRGYSLAEIHVAMEAAKSTEPVDGLHVHVYVCSYMAGRDGRNVLGVMYDFNEGDLNRSPREGVAVFHDHPMLSDPRVPDDLRQREYVYTVVHEIGHALNLLHSFDKARPSALSWMNYPHLYPRGQEASAGHDGTTEFWHRFPERFDDEEILHLHHATPREIAAGGFAFGTYEEGASTPFGGASSPRLTRPGGNPLRAMGGIDLSVRPLKREYVVGEPVFVSVGLRNSGDRMVRVPDALDPTDGFLRLTFRSPSGRVIPYTPPVRFCRQSSMLHLPPGGVLRGFDGAPVFLSASGPVFTEPGDYQVSAELTGVDGSRVVYGRAAPVRVVVPDRDTERFAEELWDSPAVLRALYLRHPLVAPAEWSRFVDRPLPAKDGNTTEAYFGYIAGLGWSTPFAPGHKRREYEISLDKASAHLAKVDPTDLPTSVRRRVEAVAAASTADRTRGGRAAAADTAPADGRGISARAARQGVGPAASAGASRTVSERLRLDVPPAGLFGAVGLDRQPPVDGEHPRDPFARVVPSLRGTARFADVVSWNIEHLHSKQRWERMSRVAELIRGFRCDFWGLQEVDAASLKELVSVINSAGRTRYAYVARPEAGQQSGALFRVDTTRASAFEPSPTVAKLFAKALNVTLAGGGVVKRPVFHRAPLLLDVRVGQGTSRVFDFRCAIVHLKSTDTKLEDRGASLRAEAADILATWIEEDRGAGLETDYVILGDMNAETAQQGLAPFVAGKDLRLLSVGMGGRYGDEAITRVASGRLLDHIVITTDSAVYMPKEDLNEQIIVRSDTELSGWAKHFSDHVPVAVRFVLGEDGD